MLQAALYALATQRQFAAIRERDEANNTRLPALSRPRRPRRQNAEGRKICNKLHKFRENDIQRHAVGLLTWRRHKAVIFVRIHLHGDRAGPGSVAFCIWEAEVNDESFFFKIVNLARYANRPRTRRILQKRSARDAAGLALRRRAREHACP